MLDLTFAEQVKIILSRKGMTIKELAEIIEERTGKKMSRQNLTQRLGRDNFQEQDMRMIADILGCPFQLSILADSESVERASNIETVEPTERELYKLARAKERKERKVKEAEKARLADAIENLPSEMEKEPSEKEMTLGDYIDIHEELVRQETAKLPKIEVEPQEEVTYEEPDYEQPTEEVAYEEPVYEQPVEEAAYEESEQVEPVKVRTAMDDVADMLREYEEMSKQASEVKEENVAEPAREEKKASGGWRGMFQRRNRREEQEALRNEKERKEKERLEEEGRQKPLEEHANQEQPLYEEQSYEQPEYEESRYEEPQYEGEYAEEQYEEPQYTQEEYEQYQREQRERELQQYAQQMYAQEPEVVDEEAEDLTKGERNPYTNHEYESNSVRMHPKRIGYVQVYDRRDHGWTDMTEWAFLGYQERKKALLGKDYEPPIYLD